MAVNSALLPVCGAAAAAAASWCRLQNTDWDAAQEWVHSQAAHYFIQLGYEEEEVKEKEEERKKRETAELSSETWRPVDVQGEEEVAQS